MESSLPSKWDHNTFCLTLAQHLLGREPLCQRLQQALQRDVDSCSSSNGKHEIRLYWRSPLLQAKLDEQSLQVVPTRTSQRQTKHPVEPVVWIDLTWTLLPHEKDVQLVVGQLVLETERGNPNTEKTTTTTTTSATTAMVAAKYYRSPHLTQHHIQRHFEALMVDVSLGTTPTRVFADSVASAFSNLTKGDENCNNKEYLSGTSIQLYHEDMQTAAPLYEFDASSSVSELNETVLRLLLLLPLQQQQEQQQDHDQATCTFEKSAGVQDLVAMFQQWQSKVQTSLATAAANELNDAAKNAPNNEAGTASVLASANSNNKRPAVDDNTTGVPSKNVALPPAAKKIRRVGGGVHGYSRLPQRKTSSKLRYQSSPKK